MELKEFLERMERQETVPANSEAMLFSAAMTQRALEITAKLNGSYHPLEEVQAKCLDIMLDVHDSAFLYGLWPEHHGWTQCLLEFRSLYAGSGRNHH